MGAESFGTGKVSAASVPQTRAASSLQTELGEDGMECGFSGSNYWPLLCPQQLAGGNLGATGVDDDL